jgi:Holliday junction resolvasome RuvABC endonuclease subunit
MILSQTKRKSELYSILDVKIELPLPNTSEHVLMGVDPGTTHLGLAYLWRNVCHIYEVKIKRDNNPIARMLLTQEIMSQCISFFDYAPLMIIEGSSFGDQYRQVELAEVRTSAALWAIQHGIQPSIIPPSSIRKKVFGSAKFKAAQVWTELNAYPNGCDALACAYSISNSLTS